MDGETADATEPSKSGQIDAFVAVVLSVIAWLVHLFSPFRPGESGLPNGFAHPAYVMPFVPFIMMVNVAIGFATSGIRLSKGGARDASIVAMVIACSLATILAATWGYFVFESSWRFF